ncbi:transporter substrate-binding domain-containing protein [Arthrobacter mobilis]|uniref:Transporter substrate-binding domain-containing protein n=1 Tax=Arthrobacter mobilis TaxID=2724944 RepID=A0A7X6K7F1_9MICC|nr:transporter substrate-binding domain-containing protein [Arthrobacter mobilis]NKX56545.1 transporter substrate-binding domain-containing protein [Arthrobacter mobilis]
MRIVRLISILALALPVLAGCGVSIPADPEGTLERVTDGTLRVGVSPNPPWTEIRPGADPGGTESELVRQFAAAHNAEVQWDTGGEEPLIGKLERGELDLVIGGLTKESPWSEKAALTRPYTEATSPQGKTEKHVLAVRMGENAFLFALERFLLDREEAP